MVEAIGWASSAILVLTITRQVYKQWHDHTSAGVSTWLFVGQLAASTGFLFYSIQIDNWVFVVTNALMAINALLGYTITLRHRKAAHGSP